MTIQEKLYTVEEFWEIAHLAENDEKRLELVEGEIYEMPPAGGEHGELGANLLITVGSRIRQQKLGHVTAAETGYILFTSDEGKDTVRAPVVGYISFERMPNRLPPTYIPLPPDLAIEIVSPNDKPVDIEHKVTDYLRAGIRMFVFVYPATKSVYAFKGSEVVRLNVEDTLDFDPVLPGFSLPVREIF
jgi:Uma2 family endonuclease